MTTGWIPSLTQLMVVVAGTLALLVPAEVGAVAQVMSFTGGGLVGERAIFVRMTSVSLPGVWVEVGLAAEDCAKAHCLASPGVVFLDCARFVPAKHGDVAVGGTLYASAIIDDNLRLLRAVDRGPGGMDEVGLIIVDSVQKLSTSPCGAGDVPTAPLQGDFVGASASQ